MTYPASFPSLVVCEVLLVAYCLVSAGQALYLAYLVYRRDFKVLRVGFFWELSLELVCMAGAAVCVVGAYGYPPAPYELAPAGANITLWGLLVVGLVAAVLGLVEIFLHHDWVRFADVAAALIISLLGPRLHALWPDALIVAAALLAFGITVRLLHVRESLDHVITKHAPAQAIESLPEGVMCVAEDGRVLFMNDSMRAYLAKMGLPGDIADMKDAWERLQDLAGQSTGSAASESGIRLLLSEDLTLYLSHRTMRIGHGRCTCILALDVTEQDHLRRATELVNKELEEAERELRVSLANVHEVADAKARLSMRSRLHDVIGQRLSILQRHLESDDISAESAAQLEPLLSGILEDLRKDDVTNPESALSATLAAFHTAGLTYHVSGSLPSDKNAAGLFAHIVREASTNAIRHGQAKEAWIDMDTTPTSARLRFSDDGQVPDTFEEHGGISGMRHAAEELGASLEISPKPRFTIVVEVPLDGQGS